MNVLVTAGPTREPIDPVRFISNRSSGKMGYALAAVAAERGHEVHLVSGPVHLDEPAGVKVTGVTTAAEMLGAVEEHVAWCDALLMVAAVADWRPRAVAEHKLKKYEGEASIPLERTTDILMHLRDRKGPRCFVGFAAETRQVREEALRKMERKGLDLIVANDVSSADAGFGVDTNRVMLLHRDGREEALPLMSKRDVACAIIERVEQKSSMQRP